MDIDTVDVEILTEDDVVEVSIDDDQDISVDIEAVGALGSTIAGYWALAGGILTSPYHVSSSTNKFISNRATGSAWDSNGLHLQIDGTAYGAIGLNSTTQLRTNLGMLFGGDVDVSTNRFITNRATAAAWDSNGLHLQIDGTTFGTIGLNSATQLRASLGMLFGGDVSVGTNKYISNRATASAWDSNGYTLQIDGTTYGKIGLHDLNTLRTNLAFRFDSGIILDSQKNVTSGFYTDSNGVLQSGLITGWVRSGVTPPPGSAGTVSSQGVIGNSVSIYNQIGGTGTSNTQALTVYSDYSTASGGTPFFVSAPFQVSAKTAASLDTFVWAGVARLDDYATTNAHNVAFNIFAYRYGTAPTFGSNIALNDETGRADPGNGNGALEVDYRGSGPDSGNGRYCINLFAIQHAPAWATAHVYSVGDYARDTLTSEFYVCLVGHTSGGGTFAADRIASPLNWALDSSGTTVGRGIALLSEGTAKYDVGINATATFATAAFSTVGGTMSSGNAIKLGAGHAISFNGSGAARTLAYDSSDTRLEYNIAGTTRFAVNDSGNINVGVWQATEVAVLYGGTGATTAPDARTNLGLAIGTDVQAADADLSALASNSTNGLWARTGAGTGSARTITGTSNRITVTNGDGVSGNPTIDVSSSYVGQATITTLGTIGTGVWQGTAVAAAFGGFGTDISGSSGVPLFASGTPTFTSTEGTGNFVRAGSPTITTPTFATSATVPLLIGGTGTTSTLTLRTTSNAGGTTGSDIIFQGGNNGATEFGRFLNGGNFVMGRTSVSGFAEMVSLQSPNEVADFYRATGSGGVAIVRFLSDIGGASTTKSFIDSDGLVGGSVFQTLIALITATDGGATAAFTANMVGSTGGPTTAAQNGWVKMKDSGGATIWVPVWK